jgi:hypothetical protein
VGLGEFYTTDGHGKVRQLGRSDSGWRDSWTQIVAGNFGATSLDYTDLLFYDKSNKVLQFYATDGKGNIKPLSTIRLPRPGSELIPSQIVAGNFGATPKDFTDLLFYDAEKGLGEFYTTDGQGNLTRLGDPIRLPLKSSQIVAGNFGPTPRDGVTPPPKDFTDLLFYKRP